MTGTTKYGVWSTAFARSGLAFVRELCQCVRENLERPKDSSCEMPKPFQGVPRTYDAGEGVNWSPAVNSSYTSERTGNEILEELIRVNEEDKMFEEDGATPVL